MFPAIVMCEWEWLWVANWLQPLPQGSGPHCSSKTEQKAEGPKSIFLGVIWVRCVSPHAQACPPAYLLELSFHAASRTRTAGDKGGPWPSTVLTVLE